MIKQSSIDEVRNRIDIHDVINKFVKLKRNGSGYTGLCPFHNEKSPSFTVTPSKQIYKCFGCGKGGDAFKFIMEHEKKTFVESIEWLASEHHITLEYDQLQEKETEEARNAKIEMLELISWAHKKYEDLLRSLPDDAEAIQYMKERGYDRERMISWGIGFAPDNWKFLTTPCINMGKHAPGVDCGLLYTKEGRNWDFFRNRIIVPIHDHNGVLVGLAGRIVGAPDKDSEKKTAKWMNPCESLIYNKRKVLYGLWQAQKAIKDAGFAYVVEGYTDVQSMHDNGLENTVGSSGTEIDEVQARLLKRYADHVVICYDGDDAGINKAIIKINLFLKLDFKVSVIELPGKKDPDEFIREYNLTTKEEAFAEV